eukprot:m.104564 g.104564  ORF g.104564 m.104564 type:complete len:195 (+) comp9111_c8_seq7:299-883(+)
MGLLGKKGEEEEEGGEGEEEEGVSQEKKGKGLKSEENRKLIYFSGEAVVWARTMELVTSLLIVQPKRAPQPYVASSNMAFPITSLHVDNSSGSLYAGDEEGNVYAWSVPEVVSGGSKSDHWVKDSSVVVCMNIQCQTKFTSFERRHHCRSCGGVFCHKCSSLEVCIPELNLTKPVRVCDRCYAKLKQQGGTSMA